MSTKKKTAPKPAKNSSDPIKEQLKIEWWPLAEIKPYAGNPRKRSKKSVQKIAASIKEFGWRQPIVVDEKGEILVGHGRLDAAELNGEAVAPVHQAMGLSAAQKKAYRIADNRTNEETEWDEELLKLELRDLDSLKFDLTLTGFELRQVGSYIRSGPVDGEDDVPPVPKKPVTRLGDLWLLGEHRLLCGDATSAEDFAMLMDGDRIGLVVTSPPYNQQIDGFKPSGMHKEGHWVEKVGALSYPDSIPESDYQDSQRRFLETLAEFVGESGSVFYNHKNRYRDKRVVSPLEWIPGPFSLRQEIIWSRPGSVTQNARMFLPSDERIYWMYAGEDFGFNDSTDIKSWSTVWDIKLEANLTHAVGFPCELPRRCIQAVPSDNVCDPYSGSGTTLIASETQGRKFYGLEIQPSYCDVIVARWEKFTGKKAERIRAKDAA